MGRRGSIIRLLSVLLVVPLVALLAGGVIDALNSIRALRAASGVVAVAEARARPPRSAALSSRA
jgi:hypothetical protein